MNVQLSLDKMMMDRADVSARSNQNVEGNRFDDIISGKDFASPRVSERDRSAETKSTEPEKDSKDKVWSKVGNGQKNEKKESKPATQSAAMEIFLDKMESEVGVKAEDVLKAFAELSVNELVAPPEESATKVIDKLNLEGGKESRALELYNEMLAMTAAASMSNYLHHSGQQAHLQVLNKREAQLRDLRASLDVMSQQFFLNGAEGDAVRQRAALAKLQSIYGAQVQQTPNSSGDPDAMFAEASTYGMSDMPRMELENPLLSKAQNGMGEVAEAAVPMTESGMAPADNELLQILEEIDQTEGLPPELKSLLEESRTAAVVEEGDAGISARAAIKGLQPDSPGLDAFSEEAFSEVARMPAKAAWTSDFTDDSAGEELEQDASFIDRLGLGNNTNKSAEKSDFVLAAEKVTPADVQTNVKEIITQAQFLSRQGGGEMKIALSPEGLGNVNIRVVSQNGQVQVEMVASNDEAKKLLERGLADLRENLAQHKLSLESIKIDAAKDISSQLAEHQQNMEQNAQHKFLNDFRERNFAMKREFFEYANPRVPGSQTRDEAMNQDNSDRRRRGVARRLDLVA